MTLSSVHESIRGGWLAPLLLLAACGGGSADVPPSRDCTCGSLVNICLDRAHVGTRSGTATSSVAGGADVFVVVDDDGTLRVMGMPGMRISGQITSATRCGRVSGTVQAWAEPGVTFRNGTTVTSGTLSGNSDLLRLDVEWVLSSGDTGGFEAEVLSDRTAPAGQADITGLWISEAGGNIRANFDIAADGTTLGQNQDACEFDGQLIANGTNTLDVALRISACGDYDGDYAGVAVAANSGTDPGVRTADALWIHVDRDGFVFADRWTRP